MSPLPSYTPSTPTQSAGNAPYSLTPLPVEDMDNHAPSEGVGNGLSKVNVANPSQKCKEESKVQECVQQDGGWEWI